MQTGGVLNRRNSMCKGPVVGGSTEHKRIQQNSMVGVPRQRAIVRKEAETGIGGGAAMHQLKK